MGVAGDDRFDKLIAPHLDALYRAAYRLTRQIADAEDLVQEVCLRGLAELDTLNGLQSARGWLLRIQYRIFVDDVRRRRRSPLCAWPLADADAARLASTAPGPEREAEGLLSHHALSLAWDELERRQQALLALHAEGYTLGEIEQITGLTRSVLTARLHRARTRLAQRLEKHAAPCAAKTAGEST
jgi:RNA polymerase sigma factor (sigma-70 family)